VREHQSTRQQNQLADLTRTTGRNITISMSRGEKLMVSSLASLSLSKNFKEEIDSFGKCQYLCITTLHSPIALSKELM